MAQDGDHKKHKKQRASGAADAGGGASAAAGQAMANGQDGAATAGPSGRKWTLSIAVPGSILAALASGGDGHAAGYVAAQVARAAVNFQVRFAWGCGSVPGRHGWGRRQTERHSVGGRLGSGALAHHAVHPASWHRRSTPRSLPGASPSPPPPPPLAPPLPPPTHPPRPDRPAGGRGGRVR